MNFNMKMPGFEGFTITNVDKRESHIAIHIEIPIDEQVCPSCEALTRKVHDYRIQKIKHLKWFERLSAIYYRKRRYVCGECDKRFPENTSFVQRYQRFIVKKMFRT
ncbi:transposase [Viridibacillus sp. YIM B01967]|uniref:Transposase n=1 Tax=Viridibacillus soli TaxID=2798301 RepID=A0ABS1HDD8_9BACL|nr:transposase [Viridibacillus soli]